MAMLFIGLKSTTVDDKSSQIIQQLEKERQQAVFKKYKDTL